MPAYEWNFGDVNPPVHAWATLFCYHTSRGHAERGRSGVPGPGVPEAAAELHLVGESQGSRRQQPVRGRLPGAGQHRGVRPQRPVARRRPPGTGRRHRLDGVLLPEHAGDGAGTGARRPVLRTDGGQVRGALPVDRLVHGLRRQYLRRDVGRGGRLLLRRPALARRKCHAPEGAVDGGPAPAVRHHRHLPGRCRALPRSHEAHPGVRGQAAQHDGQHRPVRPARGQRRRPAGGGQRGQAPANLDSHAGRGALSEPVWHPLAVALAQGPPLRAERGAASTSGCSTCPASRTPACSGAIPTGAAPSGCRSTC